MIVDLLYSAFGEMSFWGLVLYTLGSSAIYLVFVALAPFWIGMLTGRGKRYSKFWLIPTVQYVIATILVLLFRVAEDNNPTFGPSQGVWDIVWTLVLVLFFVVGASALITWIIAWILLIRDKPERSTTET